MSSKSLLEVCVDKSVRMVKQQEFQAFNDLERAHAKIKKEITGFTTLKDALITRIGRAIGNHEKYIRFFPSKYLSTGVDYYKSLSKYIYNDYDKDFFTTTKYGDTILVDLLREKLGRDFKVSTSYWFAEFKVHITWKNK